MKVLVIGSGVIGVTSAYLLQRCGCEVTVIEREKGPGLGTSFANGGLLTPSMPEPWNMPGCWRVLLRSLYQHDSPMQLRLRQLPGLLPWGLKFLRNSRAVPYERSTLANLKLALYSLAVLRDLRAKTGLQYASAVAGTLRVFRDEESLEGAAAGALKLLSHGLRFKRLSRAETVAMEPGLTAIGPQLVGALFYEGDETGDAFRYCASLARECVDLGVQFRYGTRIESLEMVRGRIAGVVSDQGRFFADVYVIATGSESPRVLKTLGVTIPVRPVKGYSITFPRAPPLAIPVIDDALHAGVVPIGNALRVAGTAEFGGYDTRMDSRRIDNLRRLVEAVLPGTNFSSDPSAVAWCGLRPVSVDGVPIVGSTGVPNLFINAGHGHLGWTMAAGSSQLLADLILGASPAIDPTPYCFERFARAA